MVEYLKEFWWALLLLVACIALLVFVVIMGSNGGSLDVVDWTVNPANPASPLHQILP